MSKARAFFTHLFISILIVGAFLALAFFIWYPGLYFDVDGAHNIIAVLGGVDVVLGPLLTLVVFKSGKPRLKLDLGIIAAIQIFAFVYGANIIYSERPAYVVQEYDYFRTVPAIKIDPSDVASPELQAGLFSGPLLVAIKLPDDKDQVRALIKEALEGGTAIAHRPELYVPFHERAKIVLSVAKPVSMLLDNSADKQTLRKHLAGVGSNDIETLKYFPLAGKNKVITMIIDPQTGLPLGLIDENPQ